MGVTKIRGNTQIISGSITNTEINASAGIALSKLESVTDGDIIVGSGSNAAAAVTPSGDVTLSNAGVFGIASGVIVNADVNSGAAIDYSKLATLSAGNILVGSAGNVATSVNPSGDIDVSDAGVFSIASAVIVDADVNASAAIAYSKLNLTGAILNADLAGSIAYGKLSLTGAILNADLAGSIALSKLTEAVIQADGGQAFTADQDLGGFVLTGLGSPSLTDDAATKGYVDGVASGLDVKASVRVATIAALPANTAAGSKVGKTLTADAVGVLTVDSVATVLGDRILVQDESTGSDNGIYEVTTEGTAGVAYILTRSTDADQDAEVTAGLFTFVEEGSDLADTGWVLSTNDPITVDTTALVFTQFSQAGVIEAGTGLTKSANTINFVATDASILVVADSAKVQLDATAGTIALGGAGVQIADGTSGEILIGKGGGSDTAFTAISGDITLGSDGAVAIASGVIVNADVKSDAAIDFSKLATLTGANLLVGSAGNVATSVTMSGDATLSNTGALTLASNVLKEADIVTREVPTGDLDGVDVTYVLANTPVSGSESVFLNGILQNIGALNDYQIAGATITFNSAPLTGDLVLVNYIK